MPRLTGIFEHFADIETISANDIAQWIRTPSQTTSVEDSLGNRILYPQTIAFKVEDLEMDFAILRELIGRHPEAFFNPLTKKIIIGEEYVTRFPPLTRLVTTLVEMLNPQGVIQAIVKSPSKMIQVATVIAPYQKAAVVNTGVLQTNINVMVNNKNMVLASGTITILPFKERHLKVKIGAENEILVAGGSLGLVLDLRSR